MATVTVFSHPPYNGFVFLKVRFKIGYKLDAYNIKRLFQKIKKKVNLRSILGAFKMMYLVRTRNLMKLPMDDVSLKTLVDHPISSFSPFP